jgi:hypothetical protein
MERRIMKLVGLISIAALSLSLGTTIPANAQQEQRDQQEEQKDKPAQKDSKAQPQEKKGQPEEQKPQSTTQKGQQQQKNEQSQKSSKPEERSSPQNAQQSRGEQPQQHAGNGGGRIPDDRFKANFGREHSFRVSRGDYDNHRFQYGGYSFGFVDPWPSNWLYTQNVYVIDINGVYYLCNPAYPGVTLALSFAP